MALSNARTVFGVHAITPYNRTTGEFYGTTKVLAGSNFSLSGETIDLMGGSSPYSWQTENGVITAELAITAKEYSDWIFEIGLGKTLTETAAELTGGVSVIANKFGTSVVDATVGIASIAATTADEADLKFGKYVVKAITATTVDVYASTDLDFGRGTNAIFENDLLKITATPVTIADTGATIALADYGLELTSGSGTISLTVGDTAVFDVRPINATSYEATFGGSSDVYPEFGCLVYAQQQGSGRMFELDILKLKMIGAPINFSANEFSEYELTAKASYDSAENAVFKMREIVI